MKTQVLQKLNCFIAVSQWVIYPIAQFSFNKPVISYLIVLNCSLSSYGKKKKEISFSVTKQTNDLVHLLFPFPRWKLSFLINLERGLKKNYQNKIYLSIATMELSKLIVSDIFTLQPNRFSII